MNLGGEEEEAKQQHATRDLPNNMRAKQYSPHFGNCCCAPSDEPCCRERLRAHVQRPRHVQQGQPVRLLCGVGRRARLLAALVSVRPRVGGYVGSFSCLLLLPPFLSHSIYYSPRTTYLRSQSVRRPQARLAARLGPSAHAQVSASALSASASAIPDTLAPRARRLHASTAAAVTDTALPCGNSPSGKGPTRTQTRLA